MKKILSVLLVTLMLLSPFAICVNAEGISASNTNEDKLTTDLKEHLLTVEDDEYVPIYIWLNDYGEDVFYQVLSKKLGTAITADTEEAYISNRIASKESLLKQNLEELKSTSTYSLQSLPTGEIDIQGLTPDVFRVQADISEIMTDAEIKSCIESEMSSSEIIALSERSQFLSDYRQARKAVNTSVNDSFYKLLDLSKCRDVYVHSAFPCITMKCQKSYINTLESMQNSKEIGFLAEATAIDLESETESTTATGEYPYPIANGLYLMIESFSYNGSGIKIGILENDGIFDANSPHLDEKTIVTNVPASTEIDSHATKVMAIAGGEAVAYNNVSFQGIAPSASLYYTNLNVYSSSNTNDEKTAEELEQQLSLALDWFIENNVHIINMSLGIFYGTSTQNVYQFRHQVSDKMIESCVNEYRICIVNAAGNTEYKTDANGNFIVINDINIANPGLAYNAITVGNVEYSLEHEKYIQVEDSCYYELDYLANKPDMVAVGKNIIMTRKSDDGSIELYNLGSGTSFAAPMVAGAAALMMQANSNLIGRPDAVKAILMGSADESVIYTGSGNDIVEATPTVSTSTKIESVDTILREKSGAGLLNIPAAIRMAELDTHYELDFYLNGNTYDSWLSEPITLYADSDVEAGLVFEKFTDEVLTAKYGYVINLQVTDSNGNVLVETNGDVNNVKMLKFTVKETGDYRIGIKTDFPTGYTGSNVLHATMFFTCGCKNKSVEEISSTDDNHILQCSSENCGFHYIERYNTDSYTKTLSNGVQIKYKVSYLMARTNDSRREFAHYNYYYEITSPEGITVHDLRPATGGYTQTTATGEIRRYNYEAIIEQNGAVSFVNIGGVTITIDYYDKTVTLTG